MAHYYRYHTRRFRLITCILALGVLALFAQHEGWVGTAGRAIVTNQPGMYSVKYFIDGDTIAVNMNGNTEKVRFIGVDTPETHKPNTPVQCYGPNAAAFTKKQIGHQSVRLVADSLSTDRDRYGRLLRYVYLPDGTNLDEKIIRSGFGFYYPYFPFSKASQFNTAELAAQSTKSGLWGKCHPTASDSGGYKMNELAN